MMSINAKAMAISDTDYVHLPYNSYRACLTNYMGSISYHNMSLVINSLGVDTHC